MGNRILLVEDDADIARNIFKLLAGEGYQVMVATNGQHALDTLSSAQDLPSLILLDLMMPVMDGFQFREKQEVHPKFGEIPVIILSADGNIEVKKKRTKASAYIRKPVEIDSFLEIVQMHLR